MNEFRLSREGYIRNYLYAGKKEIRLKGEEGIGEKDQLLYERKMREGMTKGPMSPPEGDVGVGGISGIGMPWKYYYSHGNDFLDLSAFYLELHRIEMAAVTELVAEESMETELCLWSYNKAKLWVNGIAEGETEKPVYKPVRQVMLKIRLEKGRNRLVLWAGTLGVRDTRVGAAIQIMTGREKIRVSLPDSVNLKPYLKAARLLDGAILKKGRLIFGENPPSGSYLLYHKENPDFCKQNENRVEQEIGGRREVILKAYASFLVCIPAGEEELNRKFERIELRSLSCLPAGQVSQEDHIREILKQIGSVRSMTRGKEEGFALYPMLARYSMGIRSDEDKKELMTTLSQISRRVDCSDFMTCALIRLVKRYGISEEAQQEMKEVMLLFRYWMDEEGQDGMCFWSENHSLMFYETAYFFGQMYPEDIFRRSGQTGKEMYRKAGMRLREWLKDVCEQGFDEFNSGVYSSITLAALLNLVDFGEEDISVMAAKAGDILVRTAARHCFRGVIIAPQGRIYRDVLYPGRQGLQGLVNYVCPEAPYVFNEWLSVLADSTYTIPEDFRELMEEKRDFTYRSSNGVIDLCKTEEYMLTSVRSPDREMEGRVWEPDLTGDKERFLYTKSLNECFHGTTKFEPGVLGYQQHLWYGALDRDLVVFTNHPGVSCDGTGECRPGYWYGNGVLPALRQEKNILGAVYVIPPSQPVGFTHVFWEEEKFRRTGKGEGWIFGAKDRGYIGLWCSTPLTDHDDVLFQCEKRSYGRKAAYLCVMGSCREDGSFEDFMHQCTLEKPVFSEDGNILRWKEFELIYEGHDNPSQYIE